MEQKTLELKLKEGTNEIITRQGDAQELPPLFPNGTKISGTIKTPREHLSKPSNWLTHSKTDIKDTPLNNSYLLVNREKMTIEFIEDYGYPWSCTYKGTLQFDERFKKFSINENKSYTAFELADLIKMNRSLFETKDKAMVLVSELRKFKAKIDKDVEAHTDDRANKKVLLAQAVETNLPENFKLVLPIFKGEDKKAFEVEITIDATDLSCRLVSPEVNDYVEETRDSIINIEVEEIKQLHPTLRIFEV